MKTRDEIAKEYKIDERGIVRSLGKFQGEPWWVVVLWDLMLDGCADRTDTDDVVEYAHFAIDDEIRSLVGSDTLAHEAKQRPSYETIDFVSVWENEHGFVYHAFVNRRDVEGLSNDT